MHRILASLLICIAATADAGVYKWTDANGKVHYSDQPPLNTDASKPTLTAPSGFSEPEAPDGSAERKPPPKTRNNNAELRKQRSCAELRADQQRLENSPSGNALKDGNQRAARAFAIEQNQAMIKELGCEATR